MPRRRPQQPQGNNSSLDPVKLKSNMETIKKSMPDDVQEALNDIGDLNKKGKPAPLKRTGGKLQGTASLSVQGQPVPLRQPSVRPNIDREGLKAAAIEADRSNWKSMKIGDMKEPEGVKWFNASSWRPQPNKPTPPQRSQTQSTQPTGQPTGVVTQPSDQQFQLGSVSEQYETGGRGAGTIGYDKYGGWSYGSYQLATKPGTLSKFLKSSDYGDQFDGLRPGTPAFNNKWKSMGDDPNFAKAQHNFIKRTHYDPAREYASKLGIPDHPAINQAIWSSSVQHGGVRKLLARAYNKVKSSFTPANFIKALYDARISYTSNNAYAPALRNRYNREKADVLSLIQ